MTETEKFYTPEMSEFHVGFGFEHLYKNHPTIEGGWRKSIVVSSDHFECYEDYIAEGRIRVRYLNHEDILACGWESADAPVIPQNHNGLFKIEKNVLAFNRFNQHCVIELYCDTRKESYVAFVGTILNINQLRTIMKMVGIKK